jgi:hypothetical protein
VSDNEPAGPVGVLVRQDPDAFDALRDTAADRLGVDPGAVEKDYWATEVLRSAAAPLDDVEQVVFKGGTTCRKRTGSSNGSPKTSTCSSSPHGPASR